MIELFIPINVVILLKDKDFWFKQNFIAKHDAENNTQIAKEQTS